MWQSCVIPCLTSELIDRCDVYLAYAGIYRFSAHVSIVYSKTPCNWISIGVANHRYQCPEAGAHGYGEENGGTGWYDNGSAAYSYGNHVGISQSVQIENPCELALEVNRKLGTITFFVDGAPADLVVRDRRLKTEPFYPLFIMIQKGVTVKLGKASHRLA